jgi:hypothetical protein
MKATNQQDSRANAKARVWIGLSRIVEEIEHQDSSHK